MSAPTSLQEANQANEVALAAGSIFGGSSNSFKSRSGKMVVIRPATMEHFGPVLRFFNAVIGSLDGTALATLVDLIASAQKEAISQGANPDTINLEGLVGRIESAEVSAESLVRRVFNGADLLTTLLAAAADSLPDLASRFTNVTAEEFNSMDPDEGIVLAVGIFTVNYDFFSRHLPPIFRAFAQSRAASSPAASAVASMGKNVAKVVKRRR